MNVLPLFYPRKTKNVVTCSVTTFREISKVVPPGIEPFDLAYPNSLIDSIF